MFLPDARNSRLSRGRYAPSFSRVGNSGGASVFNWAPFALTAGTDGVQWVGFSTGAATLPQPAFGAVNAQPSSVTDLLALYDDTNSNVYLAVFSGDWAAAMSGLVLYIGGAPFTSFETELISGNTWVRFNGLGDWVDEAVYEIEFG